MQTLIVIIGPTGVGKTEVAISVAERFGTHVLNADSRQIFSELKIGTAAPSPGQLARVAHHFVGVKSIRDYYSAALYEREVLALLPSVWSVADGVAVMAGGSMMYIDAVCKGIDEMPTVDDGTRERMKARLGSEGLAPLLAELERLDPKHYAVVDKDNYRRVVHALEICHVSGRPYSSFLTHSPVERPFKIVKVGLRRERSEMYSRINSRVEKMMEAGLLAEAESLYPFRSLTALNTVGYKELFAYIGGECALDEAVRRIQSDTRRYMRKQETWFKRDADVEWFHPDDLRGIMGYVERQTTPSL